MGHSSYSSYDRDTRSASLGYTTNTVSDIFTQSTENKAHADMSPNGVLFRESRDSVQHPNTVPIQLYLDVTGSMGHIPHEMIKTGLPTLMGSLIQNGVADASLMFGAIGDHEADRFPLQVAQFESGDAELDMWLTRTFLEGNGGGNAGESYLLAWYFAANHVQTDAFTKRGRKGFVFSIGDEPCLKNLPVSSVKAIMGATAVGQGNFTMEDLLSSAQKQNHVYHIHINHTDRARIAGQAWRQLLGDNLIEITDHREISKIIADTIISQNLLTGDTPLVKQSPSVVSDQEIFL